MLDVQPLRVLLLHPSSLDVDLLELRIDAHLEQLLEQAQFLRSVEGRDMSEALLIEQCRDSLHFLEVVVDLLDPVAESQELRLGLLAARLLRLLQSLQVLLVLLLDLH